jgi:hypothetical protein
VLRDENMVSGDSLWQSRRPPGVRRNRNRIARTHLHAFVDDLRNPGIPDEFERRIWTACMTDRALSDPDSRFQGLRPLRHAVWREAVKEWSEYGSEEVKIRFNPGREHIADWEVVMRWCATLEKKDFRIIWLRASGLFFTEIADRMLKTWDTRLSHDTAKRRYESAMLQLYELSLRNITNY